MTAAPTGTGSRNAGRPRPGTALRFALRDLRGGIRGFRVMLACLALGVGAIAAIGSMTAAVRQGLAHDARTLLGGDLELSTVNRPARAEQVAWLRSHAERLSTTVTMRAMAAAARPTPGHRARALVELKAVDPAYPLYGRVGTDPAMPLKAALGPDRSGAFGALAENTLFVRLGLKPGARIRVGTATLVLRARLSNEPDKAGSAFKLGPRLLISAAALKATGLIQPGSLVRYHYRLKYRPGTDGTAFEAALRAAFPEAVWRMRDAEGATSRIKRYVDRATLFFTLVGLTALLVGGIGVAGAVKGHLDARRETIATLKCLGAPGRFVLAVFAAEVGLIAAGGIALGLVAGAGIPALALPALGRVLPVVPAFGLFPVPLLVAALYGVAVAVLFTLWPLARAREVPAAALFRGVVAETRFRPRTGLLAGLAAAALAIAALAVLGTDRPRFVLWFILGAAIAFALFAALGILVRRLAAGAERRLVTSGKRAPRLSLALANIARPGSPAGAIVLAFGVALTLFVALALVEANFQRELADRLPKAAPAYFFIDIQPGQVADFVKTVRAVPGTGAIKRMPSLRGRIVKANGKPIVKSKVGPGARWAVDSDRGLTYAARMPANADLVAGHWWPADYSGPPLLSLYDEFARGLGLHVGDTLTVNVLGREVTARIANLRDIDWSQLGLNFTMIFSPGVLEGAPQTYIATVHAPPGADAALARAVADRFPNITAISVREALSAVRQVLTSIGAAARAIAGLALAAGILVLAGAIAASRRERTRDTVILKVTGARRRDLALAYVIEYGIAGLAAALLAAALGTGAAWFVLTRFMHAGFAFLPVPVAETAAAATVAVIALGYLGTHRALTRKPAPILRGEAA